MARHATADEAPRIVRLLRNFHAAGEFGFSFDAARLNRLVRHAITSPDYACLVVGQPAVGVLIASCGESVMAPIRFAEELLVFIEPEARGDAWTQLLAGLEAWARAQGCQKIKLSAQQHIRPAAMARLYRRAGYVPRETVFSKDL
jgi:GNAT superfamily N-acetyltransferase